jgi:hypothetical protein
MPAAKKRGSSDNFSTDVAGHAFEVLRGRLLPYHHDGRGTVKSVVPSEPLRQCVEVIRRAVSDLSMNPKATPHAKTISNLSIFFYYMNSQDASLLLVFV